jgi:LacI family transcriptional regulator
MWRRHCASSGITRTTASGSRTCCGPCRCRTLLERKFTRLIGESPHRRIKRQQLERARQLLAETELPIARIADLAGFESASYLSASFRRETGQNPRAFRDQHRRA